MFIKTTRPSDKLNFTKLKSFKILKVLKLVTYKLDLSDSMKIIRIRHILVLELVNLEVSLIKDILDINLKSQKEVWEIKKILDVNLINNN